MASEPSQINLRSARDSRHNSGAFLWRWMLPSPEFTPQIRHEPKANALLIPPGIEMRECGRNRCAESARQTTARQIHPHGEYARDLHRGNEPLFLEFYLANVNILFAALFRD